MLIEIIFIGNISTNFAFLQPLLLGCRNLVVNSFTSLRTSDNLMEIIKNEETYNIAFGTDHLLIKEIKVPNVFIDLSKESGEIELLLFFDLRDLAKSELIKGLLLCREWCAYMAHEYGFTDYICQIDNGSENEFFFDKNSWGPYYELLKSQT